MAHFDQHNVYKCTGVKSSYPCAMADTQRGTPPEWSAPPETELRRLKTMVEDEMMIKLGAKKETVSR